MRTPDTGAGMPSTAASGSIENSEKFAATESVRLEPGLTLNEVRYRYVMATLERNAGRVAVAAKQLGISTCVLYQWLRQWNATERMRAMQDPRRYSTTPHAVAMRRWRESRG